RHPLRWRKRRKFTSRACSRKGRALQMARRPLRARPPPWAAPARAGGFAAATRSSCLESEAAMPIPGYARWMLMQESRALLTRLARVKPFALQESMLPAAALLPKSQTAIETFLMAGRGHLRSLVLGYMGWLNSPQAGASDAQDAQRRFSILR